MPHTRLKPSDISNRFYGSFAVVLSLLLVLVTFSYFNFQRLVEADRINVHTYKVLLGSYRLSQSMTNTDSALRAFAISGNEGFLPAYRKSLHDFNRHFSNLKVLTNDRPSQQRRLQQLSRQHQRWLSRELQPLIAARRRARSDAEGLRITARSASSRRARINAMQSILGAMEATENDLLRQRSREQQIFQDRTGWTLLLGGLLSIVLALSLSTIVGRNTRVLASHHARLAEEVAERRRAEARLQELVGQLEQANTLLESGNRELAQLNTEFERANNDLQRSNAELEQFAYVASHDLQEPLRAVGGCVQVLQRRYADKLDERADELIRHAVDGATRMQTLINDLLTFSRVGTHGKPFEPVDMELLIKRVRSYIAIALQESGAQLTIDPMPIVTGDRGQLEQVMQNLLTNAIKFRNPNAETLNPAIPSTIAPTIHIGAQRNADDHAWVFSVRDNGLGIEPKYFERIFIMFQRLHTRTDYAGTGIGLAICKKIVERHGGHIWVESQPRQGATFSFSIPDFIPDTTPKSAVSLAKPAPVENASNGQAPVSNGAEASLQAATLKTQAGVH